MLPTTKQKFRYLLVCVDLATDEFDIEPMKNKEATTTLKALEAMFKRDHINKPKYSLATDSGSEFKSVFHKWLYDQNIYHKVALPNRHTQMANVEALNKQLGRLLNGYMNGKEEASGKPYNEWTDVLGTIRTDLNDHREKPTYSPFTHQYPIFSAKEKPKYKVGDTVYRQSDVPLNALGNKQPTNNYRMGDYRFEKIPKKITKIIYMSGNPPYRYMLEGLSQVSYTEAQLLPAKAEETETKYIVKEIIGKKIMKKKIHYLIWWKGEKKDQATWEPKDNLIEDGFTSEIEDYDKHH